MNIFLYLYTSLRLIVSWNLSEKENYKSTLIRADL
jgi:hypothetical protein